MGLTIRPPEEASQGRAFRGRVPARRTPPRSAGAKAMRLDYQKLSAAGLRALGGVHVYVQNSGLPKALVDLVFLRASQINGCAYCIDMHARDLMKGGMPVDKVMLVSAWREAGDAFTAKEKAALGWTE